MTQEEADFVQGFLLKLFDAGASEAELVSDLLQRAPFDKTTFEDELHPIRQLPNRGPDFVALSFVGGLLPMTVRHQFV